MSDPVIPLKQAIGDEVKQHFIGNLAPELKGYTVYSNASDPVTGIIVAHDGQKPVGEIYVAENDTIPDFEERPANYYQLRIKVDFTPKQIMTAAAALTSVRPLPETRTLVYGFDWIDDAAAVYALLTEAGFEVLIDVYLCIHSNPSGDSLFIRRTKDAVMATGCVEMPTKPEYGGACMVMLDPETKMVIGKHTCLPDCAPASDNEYIRLVTYSQCVATAFF